MNTRLSLIIFLFIQFCFGNLYAQEWIKIYPKIGIEYIGLKTNDGKYHGIKADGSLEELKFNSSKNELNIKFNGEKTKFKVEIDEKVIMLTSLKKRLVFFKSSQPFNNERYCHLVEKFLMESYWREGRIGGSRKFFDFNEKYIGNANYNIGHEINQKFRWEISKIGPNCFLDILMVDESNILITGFEKEEIQGVYFNGFSIEEIKFLKSEYDVVLNKSNNNKILGEWRVLDDDLVKPYLKAPVSLVFEDNQGKLQLKWDLSEQKYLADISKNSKVLFIHGIDELEWVIIEELSDTKMILKIKGENVIYKRGRE